MWPNAAPAFRIALMVTAVSSCLLSVAMLASANPIAPTQDPDTTFRLDDDPVYGIARLTLLNLFINTALFSIGFLAVASSSGRRLGNISGSTIVFFIRYIACAISITVAGAFVDYYLLTEKVLLSSQPRFADPLYDDHMVLYFDAVNWAVACLLIFLSVMAASTFVLGMSVRPSLPIAAGMTCVNPVWWWLIYRLGEDVAFLTLLFGILASPILVAAVVKWHSSDYRMRLAVEHGAPS